MIHYTVKAEEGIVEASISGCSEDIVNKLRKALGENAVPKDSVIYNAALMKDEFHSRAKCHADDEFTEEEGKRVAKRKVLDDYNEKRIQTLNQVELVLSDYSFAVMREINRILDTCSKHNNK